MERVVLLTPLAYYVVHYEFGTDTVGLFERVLFADVERVDAGHAAPSVPAPRAPAPPPRPSLLFDGGGAASDDDSDDEALDSADPLVAGSDVEGVDEGELDGTSPALSGGSDLLAWDIASASASASASATPEPQASSPASRGRSPVLRPAMMGNLAVPATALRRRSSSVDAPSPSEPHAPLRGATSDEPRSSLPTFAVTVHFRRAVCRSSRAPGTVGAAGNGEASAPRARRPSFVADPAAYESELPASRHVFVVAPAEPPASTARSPLDLRTVAEQETRLRRLSNAVTPRAEAALITFE